MATTKNAQNAAAKARAEAEAQICKINEVEGFNPYALCQKWPRVDPNTGETVDEYQDMPAKVRKAWFRKKYEQGQIRIHDYKTLPGGGWFFHVRVYADKADPVEDFLGEGVAIRYPNKSPDQEAIRGISIMEWAKTKATSNALDDAGFGLGSQLVTPEDTLPSDCKEYETLVANVLATEAEKKAEPAMGTPAPVGTSPASAKPNAAFEEAQAQLNAELANFGADVSTPKPEAAPEKTDAEGRIAWARNVACPPTRQFKNMTLGQVIDIAQRNDSPAEAKTARQLLCYLAKQSKPKDEEAAEAAKVIVAAFGFNETMVG